MSSSPTTYQIAVTREVVRWYLREYFDTPDDPGTVRMFLSPDQVGHFAVDRDELRSGEPNALFRLLVATSMFQRLRDALVLKILRGISQEDVEELSTPSRIRELANSSGCEHSKDLHSLVRECDLSKDHLGRGTCEAKPRLSCYLKRHTVLLKRYGHFGKVPTAAVLTLDAHRVEDLRELRRRVLQMHADPLKRAIELEESLSRSWRISKKIASMFLSAIANPDLSRGTSPWSRGIDWTHYVVCDSNVDAYLANIGYAGPWSYEPRRAFIQTLSRNIDLTSLRRSLRSYNPRLVQQAIYVFAGKSNRRERNGDCSHRGLRVCAACPKELHTHCPLKSAAAT